MQHSITVEFHVPSHSSDMDEVKQSDDMGIFLYRRHMNCIMKWNNVKIHSDKITKISTVCMRSLSEIDDINGVPQIKS
jgi:hypothetical protein